MITICGAKHPGSIRHEHLEHEPRGSLSPLTRTRSTISNHVFEEFTATRFIVGFINECAVFRHFEAFLSNAVQF